MKRIYAHDKRRSAAVQVSDFDCLSNLAFRGAGGASIVGELCDVVRVRCNPSVTIPTRSLYLAGMAPSFKVRSRIAMYDCTNCGS